MSTGSIHPASKTVFRNYEHDANNQSFSAGAVVVEGQNVKITGDWTVEPVSGNEVSIGVAKINAAAVGDDLSVMITAIAVLRVESSGGAIVAGAYVQDTGTLNADNVPIYITAPTTEQAHGIVYAGAAGAGQEMTIGLLRAPIVAP